MREIKFRAWDDKFKIMIIDPMIFNGKAYYIDHHDTYLKHTEINGEIMQFTGLYDKYKTPIYESDIIKSDLGTIVEVYWLEDDAVFSCKNDKTKFHSNWTLAHFWTDGIEVIGNRFEGVREIKIMKQYIVWECIKHEGWEPYHFQTLKEADKFMNRKDKDEYLIDTILTKQINVVVEDNI